VIHARGLVHTFRTRRGREKVDVTAVQGVDLDVDAGEIVAFLGPNGAGKTTTLRILTTLLRPTQGTARVAGFDVATEPVQVRQHIGYVSQSGSTSSVARAGDEVVDHGLLYGIDRAQAERRARELFAQLDLDGLWSRQPKSLSGGQRRRLDVAMGLIHDPALVFLDEPTSGLDPQARANLWSHIEDLRDRRGTTVFLTTHYLDEADALSDRLVVIDHGRIVASDTAENLKAGVAGDLVHLEVSDAAKVQVAAQRLEALTGGSGVEVDATSVRGRVARAGTVIQGLMRELDRVDVALTSIEVRPPTLDDVFLNLTGRSLRDDAAA